MFAQKQCNIAIILTISVFLFSMGISNEMVNIPNSYAQESNTTSTSIPDTSAGNITGGGVNVPLNETSMSDTSSSLGNLGDTAATTATQQNSNNNNNTQSFMVDTDMMKPVIYLVNPSTDEMITVDLSQDPQYPNGSMPLHLLATPDGKRVFLSTMSTDTAPATILAIDLGNIDWSAGTAQATISNVITVAEAGSKPVIPNIQNHTSNNTQPVIASMWLPNNIQIHGPTLHPSGKFGYFTEWHADGKIRVIDVTNGSLAASDPIQIQQDNATSWLHGVFFNPSGNKALSPHYFFEGNHVHLFDVNPQTGDLSNHVQITLGYDSAYASLPHFVTWINETHAITSTQQLGPTSLTPENAVVLGPSVWLIDTEGNSAEMIIPSSYSPNSNNTDANGIIQSASDTAIIGNKLYVAEEDSVDEQVNNRGYVQIFDISNINEPKLIKTLSPGNGLPENFELGHALYPTDDERFIFVQDWHSGQLVKIDTANDEMVKVFDKENSGFEMPHGGFITGKYR